MASLCFAHIFAYTTFKVIRWSRLPSRTISLNECFKKAVKVSLNLSLGRQHGTERRH